MEVYEIVNPRLAREKNKMSNSFRDEIETDVQNQQLMVLNLTDALAGEASGLTSKKKQNKEKSTKSPS